MVMLIVTKWEKNYIKLNEFYFLFDIFVLFTSITMATVITHCLFLYVKIRKKKQFREKLKLISRYV